MTTVTWNPSEKGPTTVLSNGDLSARASNLDGVKATKYRNDGKRYFEIVQGQVNGAQEMIIGVSNAAASVGVIGNGYPGDSAGGYGYWASSTSGPSGKRLNNAVEFNYGAKFTTNDTISVLVDFSNGQINFWKNGVDQGIAYTVGPGLNVAPHIGVASSSSNAASASANFGATEFAFTPPEGYISWEVDLFSPAKFLPFFNLT